MDSSRPKKRKQRSLAHPFVVTLAVGVPVMIAGAGMGCGNTGEPAAAGPGNGSSGGLPGVANGPCKDEGAEQPCHVNAGKSGNGSIQNCFVGIQTCTGGLWSSCGGEGMVVSSFPSLNLVPPGGLSTRSHTGFNCPNGSCTPPQCKGGLDDNNTCYKKSDCRPDTGDYECLGGPSEGSSCLAANVNTAVGCPGGLCLPEPTCGDLKCAGGTNNGSSCLRDGMTNTTECPLGTCQASDGETCGNCPADCGGCAGSAPLPGVSICTSDPCNPNCQGWLQTGVSSNGGVGGTVIGVSGFGQIKNGQLQKLLLDSCHTGSSCDAFGAHGVPSSYYTCQIDTYCQMSALGGDGCCKQFPAPLGVQGTDLESMGANAGVDVTIGPGCSDTESDKYRYFPICNRGATAIPAGTVIRVKYFNPNEPFNPCSNTTCTNVAGYDCSMVVGDAVSKNGSTSTSGLPLLPGQCQLLDTEQLGRAPGGGACSQPNGNKWIYANCDGATTGVIEGNITMKPGAGPVGVTGAPANEPTTVPGILGCANNWTDHSPDNNPPSCGLGTQNIVVLSNDYQAICPTGTGPVWSKLIYDSSCPKNGSGTSEVFFEAATAPLVAGIAGVYSDFYEIAEAQRNNAGNPYVISGATLGRDPEKCTFTLPALPSTNYAWNTSTNANPLVRPPTACPKDIEAQFKRSVLNTPFPGAGPGPGALLARQDFLRLRITIKSTPDSKQNATLNNWSLSYSCVARE